MRKLLVLVFALNCLALRAADAPASEASIREMLVVTDVRKMVDAMFPQVETMMRNSMAQATGGRMLSADEQATVDKMIADTVATMRDEMAWSKLEPMYFNIYQKSFTQSEIDGMLAFYKSPAGSALIKKMPVVMQESMSAMQERMGPMMRRIQGSVQQTVMQLNAAGAAKKD